MSRGKRNNENPRGTRPEIQPLGCVVGRNPTPAQTRDFAAVAGCRGVVVVVGRPRVTPATASFVPNRATAADDRWRATPIEKEVASLILAGQHIEMLEQHDAAQARSAAEAAATVTPEDADAAPRAVDCSPRRLSAASAAAAARSPLSPQADPGNRGTNPPAADPPPQRPPAGPG